MVIMKIYTGSTVQVIIYPKYIYFYNYSGCHGNSYGNDIISAKYISPENIEKHLILFNI
jgi:hypothetical protein